MEMAHASWRYSLNSANLDVLGVPKWLPSFFYPEGGVYVAKMIPERPSEETLSSAEIKLFQRFKAMPETDDWVVLHSLAIARHTTQSQGEADFTVVIPSFGVFVLEVKGGLISYSDGIWYSKDRENVNHQIKNPVEEANNAMHSIKEYIGTCQGSPNLVRSLFGFGVVFPNTTVHGIINTVELADEQIADFDDCLSPEDLKNYLLRMASFWKKRRAPIITLPTKEQCSEIVSLLRPNFEGRVSLRSIIRNVENQVVSLTENQQDIFETIIDNPRCIVRGGAGTGKTIIALHFAKQMSGRENKTGFFCYNKQLSDYLKNNVKQTNDFICDSFTEYMESVVAQAGKHITVPHNSTERNVYYQENLPQIFMEVFLELDLPQFSYLIVDEAQDLMIPRYLEAMDFVLNGGLQNGNWYFFMDAERQNLFHNNKSDEDILQMLQQYNTHYTQCRLKDNCRNSVAIIEKLDQIFGTTTRHKHNDERGTDVVIKSYKKTAEQVASLETILRMLLREGVAPEQIVILSTIRFSNSAASMVTEFKISDRRDSGKETIFFSTIHSFKGLESPVVILSDIDNLTDEARMNILYVGMTRAKSALYILTHEKTAKQFWR